MLTTARVLLITAVTAALLLICWPLAGLGKPTEPLLSQHSQPAAHLPSRLVAIVEGGKTFHDPKCTMMHGKPRMVTAGYAAQMGYSPCTRCMREALNKP